MTRVNGTPPRLALADAVRQIVAGVMERPAYEIERATTFASIGADPLDMLDIAIAAEETFHIQLPDEAQNVASVGDFITAVEQELGFVSKEAAE